MSKNDEYVSHMRKLFFFSAARSDYKLRALNAAQETERQKDRTHRDKLTASIAPPTTP